MRAIGGCLVLLVLVTPLRASCLGAGSMVAGSAQSIGLSDDDAKSSNSPEAANPKLPSHVQRYFAELERLHRQATEVARKQWKDAELVLKAAESGQVASNRDFKGEPFVVVENRGRPVMLFPSQRDKRTQVANFREQVRYHLALLREFESGLLELDPLNFQSLNDGDVGSLDVSISIDQIVDSTSALARAGDGSFLLVWDAELDVVDGKRVRLPKAAGVVDGRFSFETAIGAKRSVRRVLVVHESDWPDAARAALARRIANAKAIVEGRPLPGEGETEN